MKTFELTNGTTTHREQATSKAALITKVEKYPAGALPALLGAPYSGNDWYVTATPFRAAKGFQLHIRIDGLGNTECEEIKPKI